ncbi:GNAT family N-acetyltransferase [Embleya scabrispora]|uniref:GNAT family N-acetyltransferase n=1 Tax=Embleya scabrispora TaxID=159449 RepID=UPI0003805698|nr:GNAT family N-acetyltransferase [Embleya scabrispora]MYS83648.1 GNAT family N-acetyltransferase [Streptomyces sp. SID5474]
MPKSAAEMRARLETFYDAMARRSTRAETFGGLTLFVREGQGWPRYARPTLGGSVEPTAADVRAVRARQRELKVPESFEWVDETTPALRAAAIEAELHVHEHPLMVLDPSERPAERPELPDLVTVRRVRADATDLAIVHSVATVGFANPGTASGTDGPTERDTTALVQDPDLLSYLNERLRSGETVMFAAYSSAGPLCVGSYQQLYDTTEIVGVATLPAARRGGLAAAVTWELAGHALDGGSDTVFLSAGDQDVARMYGRLGFRSVGTALIAEAP